MAQSNTMFMFSDDSDADSIATDSTQAEQAGESYGVEKILAEDNNWVGTGETKYLIKWEGYPLGEATWEPPENIDDDILLQQWEEHKRLVRAGRAQAFDVGEFERAFEIWAEGKAERHRRRKEKRRKRGLSVSADENYEEAEAVVEASPERRRKRTELLDSGDEDVIASAKPKRTKQVNVKRKGIAQKLSGSRRVIESASDEDSELHSEADKEDDSEPDSLFDEGSQPIYPPSQSSESKKPSFGKVTGSRTKAAAKAPTSILKPPKAKPVVRVETVTRPAARKSMHVPAATSKPATATKTAKRTGNLFANWGAEAKKRKRRLPLTADISKDTGKPRFYNLAIQNNVHKYSRTEPAPDPNALNYIDPKTGRAAVVTRPTPQTPNVHTSTSKVPEIPSAYGRRTPSQERRRSITPPPPPPPLGPRDTQAQSTQLPIHPAVRQPHLWQSEVCWNWRNGDCKETAETCPFAHHAIGKDQAPPPPPPPAPVGYTDKKLTTCKYWYDGRCMKPEEVCEFAHRDTGVYSKAAYMDAGGFPNAAPARNIAPAMNAAPARRPTCHFWLQGRCRHSAADCKFAHEDTGVHMPAPPHKYRMVDIPAGAHSTGANMEPVGGFSHLPIDTTTIADDPMTLPTATNEGERTVRFAIPQSNGGAPPPPDSADSDSGSLPVQISFGPEHGGQSRIVEAELEMAGFDMFKTLLLPVAKGVYLFPDHMITARDLQTFHPEVSKAGPNWPAGSVRPQAASVAMCDKLAKCCKLHASGFVSVQDRFTLLIYPSNSDEWRFVERTNLPTAPKTSLRFCMFPPIQDFDPKATVAAVAEPVSLQLSAAALVSKALLSFDSSRVVDKGGDQKMFIAWPAHRTQELMVLVKYFQGLHCKVYHSGTPGAWAYFRGKAGKGSVVIVHPEVPLWEIPKLYTFLMSDVKFYAMRTQSPPGTDTDHQHTLHCERLFPHGGVTFITDDVLVYDPEKATEIIKAYLKTNAAKPAGGEHDKIAARPGVKAWLRKIAQENTAERGRPDGRWLELYESVCKLCPPEAEDPYDLGNPLPSSNLVSIPAEELPSFYGLWEKDEEAATNMMVEWFAGWSAMNAYNFRRIRVCYEPKGGEMVQSPDGRFSVGADPREWSKKYQHIGVLRPDDIFKEAAKEAKAKEAKAKEARIAHLKGTRK